jgi:hypothetical protein
MTQIKVKDLKGTGVPVRFGPLSDPEKYKIDLLEEARQRFSVSAIDFDELELEIGDRLEDKPYSDTGRARMPPSYLCEGSVWLNCYTPDGKYANIALVPFLDKTEHRHGEFPHHNFYIYWTDLMGQEGSERRISGHKIPVDQPVVVSISCDTETRKGTIKVSR